MSLLKDRFFLIVLYELLFIGLLLLFVSNIFRIKDAQHFVYLSESFIEGRLFYEEVPSTTMGWNDTSFYNGSHYWPLGVFPALVLTPFVFLFGSGFYQGYLSVFLTFLTLFFLYKIFLKITEGKRSVSLLLSFAFVFSTAYFMVGLRSFSWYFAHVVACACLTGALYFALVRKKAFLAGLLFAFSFLTRIDIALGIGFFIFYFLFLNGEGGVVEPKIEGDSLNGKGSFSNLKSKLSTLEKRISIKRLYTFMLPVFFGIAIFFTYNYLRFGDIFETGYKYQILIEELSGNRDIGMWSFAHFPTNIYLLFLKGPMVSYLPGTMIVDFIKPDKWGMSIIFTSPVLLYLVFADYKNKMNLVSLVSASFILFFLLGSFGTGAYQYGYRFALDFQPFLFLILADLFRKKDPGLLVYFIVYASFFFNLFMTSLFYLATS